MAAYICPFPRSQGTVATPEVMRAAKDARPAVSVIGVPWTTDISSVPLNTPTDHRG